jgi:hypothetical protein
MGREESSFSEEKEAKRLFEALRGGCSRPSGMRRRLGARATPEKSLFASFSSEKEESCLLSS